MLEKKEYLEKHFTTTDPWAAAREQAERVSKWWIDKTPKDVSSLPDPYYAPGHHDPPIPTTADIIAAQSTELDRYRPVYRVFGKYVAKRKSPCDAFIEAENHLYLERHSNVRVPKLYAVFPHEETTGAQAHEDNQGTEKSKDPPTSYYIIMEYIPGVHLEEKAYNALDKSLQEKAGRAFGLQVKALRAVPSEGYYGLLGNKGWPPTDSFLRCPGKDSVLGPYSSYEQFVDNWYDAAVFRASTDSRPDYTEQQLLILRNFKRIMLSIPESERVPCLYHRDLCLGNVIFEEIKNAEGKVEDFKATLIDFESLCWLPAWTLLEMIKGFHKERNKYAYYAAAEALEPEVNVALRQWLDDRLVGHVLRKLG